MAKFEARDLFYAFAVFIVILLVASPFFLKKGAQSPVNPANDSGATREGVLAAAQSGNDFALSLYGKLSAEKEGSNIFFSPYSISSAFGMVYEGARGKTADEIRNAFGYPAEDLARRSSFAATYNLLNKPDTPYELATANALWAQEVYPFLPEYLNVVKDYYGGEARNMDFVAQSEQSRQTINDWVAGKTNDKILNLLPQGSLTELTRLVITNAVYFKGEWEHPFVKGKTAKADFAAPGRTVSADLMTTDEEQTFRYSENGDFQAIELPYKGGNVSMVVILPKREVSIKLIESKLTDAFLSETISGLKNEEVLVYLPRFKFSTAYGLISYLQSLGISEAFTDSADFSGMDGTKGLYISGAFHKAYIDVYEEGTEAAAATGVVVSLKAMPAQPKIFRADRPFLFLIMEKSTGTILFLGRMSDPTAA